MRSVVRMGQESLIYRSVCVIHPLKHRYVSRDPCLSVLSWAPSPICLGSVSPSPYKVARHKSPTEPRTAPNHSSSSRETLRQFPVDPLADRDP